MLHSIVDLINKVQPFLPSGVQVYNDKINIKWEL
jgi:hypothetical protein